MASAVACTGPALASLKKLLAEPSATGAPVAYYGLSPAAVRRLYSTQGKEVRRSDDDDDDTNGEYEDADAVGRRRARDSDLPSFFSHDVFDRFGAPTSLGRLLGLMEDAVVASGPGGLSSTARRGWLVAKEDDDAVYLKVPNERGLYSIVWALFHRVGWIVHTTAERERADMMSITQSPAAKKKDCAIGKESEHLEDKKRSRPCPASAVKPANDET